LYSVSILTRINVPKVKVKIMNVIPDIILQKTLMFQQYAIFAKLCLKNNNDYVVIDVMCCVCTAETHFCHGYTDEHGIWNNGFYCPKWGDPGERYCCSDEKAHFCCPPPTPSTRLLLPPFHSHDTTTASAGAPRSAAIPM
jgi:hypothetical protein